MYARVRRVFCLFASIIPAFNALTNLERGNAGKLKMLRPLVTRCCKGFILAVLQVNDIINKFILSTLFKTHVDNKIPSSMN